MKCVLFVSMSLFSILSFCQQTDFIVSAGTQRTITPAERTLSLKTLSLGDNCTVIIPASMDGWSVTASDVVIGSNVKIIGQGIHGVSGSNGGSAASSAACMSGMSGAPGSNGLSGSAGKNVFMNLRIRKIGSLSVNVNGGNAGNGGKGGNGGAGGNATCSCNAGTGGNGAFGGRGGNGGNGGNVTISYSVIGNSIVENSQFVIQNSGGTKGVGGSGGAGGAGGAGGGCSDPKAAIKPAGLPGRGGAQGVTGLPGANGVATLQKK